MGAATLPIAHCYLKRPHRVILPLDSGHSPSALHPPGAACMPPPCERRRSVAANDPQRMPTLHMNQGAAAVTAHRSPHLVHAAKAIETCQWRPHHTQHAARSRPASRHRLVGAAGAHAVVTLHAVHIGPCPPRTEHGTAAVSSRLARPAAPAALAPCPHPARRPTPGRRATRRRTPPPPSPRRARTRHTRQGLSGPPHRRPG